MRAPADSLARTPLASAASPINLMSGFAARAELSRGSAWAPSLTNITFIVLVARACLSIQLPEALSTEMTIVIRAVAGRETSLTAALDQVYSAGAPMPIVENTAAVAFLLYIQ